MKSQSKILFSISIIILIAFSVCSIIGLFSASFREILWQYVQVLVFILIQVNLFLAIHQLSLGKRHKDCLTFSIGRALLMIYTGLNGVLIVLYFLNLFIPVFG